MAPAMDAKIQLGIVHTLAQADVLLATLAVAISGVCFFISGLISATRSTILKLNVAAIFSFIIYGLGVQVLLVDFLAAPINYVFVGLPLIVAPLARTGLSAELSLVTPVIGKASLLIQQLVLDSDSISVRTRKEALKVEEQLLATSQSHRKKRYRASAMLFGRSSSKNPPFLSPLRLMWCIMAAVMFMFLRDADLLDPQLSTLVVWVICTLVILVIERQLHIKSRFVDAAAKGRERMRQIYDLRFHLNKRDAPTVDAARVPAAKTPLLVFVNTKSGGGVGQLLMRELRALGFHPCQIWELAGHRPPQKAFSPWLSYLRAGRSMRVLVAGGDGTVSWVLGSDGIESLPSDVDRAQLPVAVLPLGTGNDLANALGWGTKYSAHGNGVVPHLLKVVKGKERLLDRWAIAIAPHENSKSNTLRSRTLTNGDLASNTTSQQSTSDVGNPVGKAAPKPEVASAEVASSSNAQAPRDEILSMINYCGFGCGARVALNFHTLREQHRWLFCSQGLNKLIYANIGGGQVLRSRFCFGCGDSFAQSMEVICDGQRLENLEELGLEGIIVLNINSYGGGADLWANAIEAPCYRDCLERRKQHNSCFENEENRANISSNLLNVDGSIAMSKSDGHLEVLGVRMVHLATSQVKTGLASGLKLAQARKITIHIRGSQPIAMQVDGEPRLQEPATIELRSAPEGAAVVLQPVAEATNSAVSFANSVLEWGQVKGIINAEQRLALQEEAGRQMVEHPAR